MESFISRWWRYIWQQDSIGDISSNPQHTCGDNNPRTRHPLQRLYQVSLVRSMSGIDFITFIQKELLGNNWFDEPNLLKGADWTCLYLRLHPSLLRSHPGGVNWPACVPMSCASWARRCLGRTVTHLPVTPHDKLPPPQARTSAGMFERKSLAGAACSIRDVSDVPQL